MLQWNTIFKNHKKNFLKISVEQTVDLNYAEKK